MSPGQKFGENITLKSWAYRNRSQQRKEGKIVSKVERMPKAYVVPRAENVSKWRKW